MMMFRTNSSGRDSKHRMKELILDEHVECGCQCLNTAQCVGMFNEATCDCECEEERFGERKQVCERSSGAYWESSMCRCMSKSVETRGLDYQKEDCRKERRCRDFVESTVDTSSRERRVAGQRKGENTQRPRKHLVKDTVIGTCKRIRMESSLAR